MQVHNEFLQIGWILSSLEESRKYKKNQKEQMKEIESNCFHSVQARESNSIYQSMSQARHTLIVSTGWMLFSATSVVSTAYIDM